MFLLLDRSSSGHDREMAEHITYVHRHKKHPEKVYESLSAEFLRAYISLAKKVHTSLFIYFNYVHRFWSILVRASYSKRTTKLYRRLIHQYETKRLSGRRRQWFVLFEKYHSFYITHFSFSFLELSINYFLWFLFFDFFRFICIRWCIWVYKCSYSFGNIEIVPGDG